MLTIPSSPTVHIPPWCDLDEVEPNVCAPGQFEHAVQIKRINSHGFNVITRHYSKWSAAHPEAAYEPS